MNGPINPKPICVLCTGAKSGDFSLNLGLHFAKLRLQLTFLVCKDGLCMELVQDLHVDDIMHALAKLTSFQEIPSLAAIILTSKALSVQKMLTTSAVLEISNCFACPARNLKFANLLQGVERFRA